MTINQLRALPIEWEKVKSVKIADIKGNVTKCRAREGQKIAVVEGGQDGLELRDEQNNQIAFFHISTINSLLAIKWR